MSDSENPVQPAAQTPAEPTTETNQAPKPKKESIEQKRKQKKILLIMTVVFIVIAIVYGLYWFFYLSHFQSTDDAYVNGNVIPITSQVSGNVIAVNADDTTFVKAGSVLVVLDATDSRAQLAQAKAALELTLRQTQQYFIRDKGLQAAIDARQASLNQSIADLKRRRQAVGVGGVSKEDLTHAQDSLTLATSSLTQAQSEWLANRAMINGTSVTKHPAVKRAIANFRQAYFNFKRTTIYAPVSGFVAKRSVQVGQRINIGMPLMAIVPLEQVWVDANFKEKQLGLMRAGQPVTASADIYGSSVEYHGRVVGFAGGTGSAFALLPAQNATGNWIKVVQRLPVRIVLDSSELQKHPLRIGLSMEVSVDTSYNGEALTNTVYHPTYQTTIFDALDKQADDMVAHILRKNLMQLNEKTITPAEGL